jgi:hypothetical protein
MAIPDQQDATRPANSKATTQAEHRTHGMNPAFAEWLMGYPAGLVRWRRRRRRRRHRHHHRQQQQQQQQHSD